MNGAKERQSQKETGRTMEEKKVAEGAKLVQELEQAPWAERPQWYFEENLKYDGGGAKQAESDEQSPATPRCSNPSCPQQGQGKLLKCSKCGAVYCSRDCQKLDWKNRHKRECPLVQAYENNGLLTGGQQHDIMEELFRRVRMYMCPFAVGFCALRGKGFVFLKSNASLGEWIYGHAGMNHHGRKLSRFVQLQYLTLGEFDSIAFEDDFELAAVRPSLQKALEECDTEKHVVIVALLRCGYFVCVRLPLVPDVGICRSLAAMYEYVKMDGPLRLNVDDTD